MVIHCTRCMHMLPASHARVSEFGVWGPPGCRPIESNGVHDQAQTLVEHRLGIVAFGLRKLHSSVPGSALQSYHNVVGGDTVHDGGCKLGSERHNAHCICGILMAPW